MPYQAGFWCQLLCIGQKALVVSLYETNNSHVQPAASIPDLNISKICITNSTIKCKLSDTLIVMCRAFLMDSEKSIFLYMRAAVPKIE